MKKQGLWHKMHCKKDTKKAIYKEPKNRKKSEMCELQLEAKSVELIEYQ